MSVIGTPIQRKGAISSSFGWKFKKPPRVTKNCINPDCGQEFKTPNPEYELCHCCYQDKLVSIRYHRGAFA